MVERAEPGFQQEIAGRALWLRGHWTLSRAATRLLALLVLLAADLSALAFSLAVAVAVRVSVLPTVSHAFHRPLYPLGHYSGLWWVSFAYLGALAYAGLYTRRDPYWEEVRRCLLGATAGAILIFAALSVAKTSDSVSRPVVVLAWGVLSIVLPLVRGAVKEILFAAGPWRKPALLVGEAAITRRLAAAFRRHRTLGYDVIEVISDPAAAPERAAQIGARDVILATPDLDRAQFLQLIERLREVAENILIVPDLAEAPVLGVEVIGLMEDRALLLRVPNNLLKPWNLALKRAFDLVVGGVLAVALLPCIALLAAAVRLDSPGPAFHVEPRVGRRRHPFACYKLRTMYQDADRLLDAYLQGRPEAALEWARYRKLRAHDPRVTRLGRMLRRYSLDELPQLINVVCGEMSLVGPRPYLPSEMALLEHDGMCGVRPGMTGLWQVSGKNELELRERARLERWYVNNWSLWLDVIVLVKTVPAIACSR
jgi:Undecaprenyl-phosphate galactose phosphotransferase WbaP